MFFALVPFLLCGFVLAIVFAIIYEAQQTAVKFSHLPWVGSENASWWALMKSRFTNVVYLRTNYAAITEKYWSQGKSCFVPSALGDHIVIPPIEYNWLLEQPDEDLNDTINLNNELQAEATIGEPFMVHSPIIRDTIMRDLTRRLASLTPDLFDELSAVIDDEWGTDTEHWKEVVPMTTILRFVARASNRVFVGPRLCRNESLIQSALTYSATLFPCSIMIRHIPKPLRPLLSPFITMSNQYHRRNVSKIIKAEVERRFIEQKLRNNDFEKASASHENRNDFIQWLIEAAEKTGSAYDRDSYIIAQRMIILQFVTMYPISNTATDALFDIISQPNSSSIIAAIRAEVEQVLQENNCSWCKRAVSHLYTIDSAIKESLRLAPVVAFGSGRRVTSKGGLTTPLSMTYLPEDSTVAIPSVAIHQDTENYAEPSKYNPFRYVQRDSSATDKDHIDEKATADLDEDSVSAVTAPPVALATTSVRYTSFGHGRLACPGRFFAADEMKLMFAYMFRNYDVELLPERPKRLWAGPFNVAPMKAAIRVRRRQVQ